MSNSKFVITQEQFETWCKKGYSVQEMADEVTRLSGIKCSPNRIRQGAKVFGISLKEKPRNNPFDFVRNGEQPRAIVQEETPTQEQPRQSVEETAVVANTTEVVEEKVFNLQ